jgi:hypothetical protein
LISLPLVLLAGTFASGLILQDGQVVFWSLLSFILYWAGVFGTLPIMEHAIRQIVRQNGETIKAWPLYRTILTFSVIPITQGTYASALFWLHFLYKIEWRGVEYEIMKKQVRLIEHKPYTTQPTGQEEGRSL